MFKKFEPQILVAVFCLVWAGWCMYLIDFNLGHRVVSYDCRLSEISPDFPIEVREQCRKMRAESGWI